ncbi:hypothetical protein [Halopseudomonas sp.]|uniref:hypothetical protein n=1 Tax=Halopseudomonas sp. TaxID=2901191 RepID=UPI00300252A7
MRDIFELEKRTRIDREQSYIRSYPYLLAWFAERELLTGADVTCAAHMVYGWMPTILELHATDGVGVDDAAALLNTARTEGCLNDHAIAQLAGLVNRSVVGASKLLHFLSPDAFAIWDSRIYRFLHQKAPHQYRVNNVREYQHYLELLRNLQRDARFPAFHAAINEKTGYPVSALRAIEIVMFQNAVLSEMPAALGDL